MRQLGGDPGPAPLPCKTCGRQPMVAVDDLGVDVECEGCQKMVSAYSLQLALTAWNSLYGSLEVAP